MAFSGALTLTDLNDFITPSQACIKPVEQLNKPAGVKNPGAATTEIRIDESGSYYEVSASNASNGFGSAADTKLEQAQINLNDCLACSGCITSAESVLITLQSHAEVMTFLSNNGDPSSSNYRLPILSIAPQSLASLATSLSTAESRTDPGSASLSTTSRQVLRRVQRFCTDVLGFAHVFDTTFARHLALQEHVREFEERREKDRQGGEQQLPMLASACPGWICYAEKAHAEMLPFIAKTKSPQQVMGTLVKNWIGKRLGKLPHQVYHVSVMPCYDKKLEASRPDFYDDVYSTRDVDCVITTGELELLMHEKGWDISQAVVGELDRWPSSSSSIPGSVMLPELLQHPGTSSGSYLQAIISHMMATSQTPLTLSVKTLRNADSEEYILRRQSGGENGHQQGHQSDDHQKEEHGEIVFKGAKCYGFRNLQNVVRKIGRERGVRVGAGAAGKLSSGAARRLVAARKNRGNGSEDERRLYDYVEVMACPGGCVNGGGQLKPPASLVGETTAIVNEDANAKWGNREWTRRVEETYWRGSNGTVELPSGMDDGGDRDDVVTEMNPEAGKAYERILRDTSGTEREGWFRTEYRAVESEVVGLAVKW